MNQAKAATVASALITNGYLPTVTMLDATTYVIDARTSAGAPVDASVVATFATGQAVAAKVDSARFS